VEFQLTSFNLWLRVNFVLEGGDKMRRGHVELRLERN